jgi:TRAP-type C4-dicarboxylate transport system substrate-binding protein
MRTRLALLLTILLVFTLSSTTFAGPDKPAAERTVIKCATVAPEGSTWMKTLEKMGKEIFLKTRGRVKFKYYPGGIAGEEKTVLEKIRYGQLQAAGLSEIGMGQIVSGIRILEIPFLFDNYEEYDHVLEGLLPTFSKQFEEKGFILLGWTEAGFAHFWSKKPIRNLEDLRGCKVWLRTDDPMLEIVLRDLGVQTVPLALSDVLTSLQTGLIDTVYLSPIAMIAFQWFPHVSHAFDIPFRNITASMMLEKKTFDRLSPADQKVVREVSARHIAVLTETTRKDNEEGAAVLKEKGIRFTAPSAEHRAELKALKGAFMDSLTGKIFSADERKRFEDLVAEAKAAPASGP